MKLHSLRWILPALGFVMCTGCTPDSASIAKTDSKAAEVESITLPNGEPSIITVQHCLIGFQGSVPNKNIRRSQSDAEQLANDLLKLLQSGDDFDEVIHQYTDDSPPGIYRMTNTGVAIPPGSDAMSRDSLVPAFGDVGFKLDVGQYGLAPFDQATSKYGWHIIKRVK